MSTNGGSVIIPSRSSVALPRHENVVVGIQSVPLLLLCVTCGNGSPSVRALREHLRKGHGINPTDAHTAVDSLSTTRSSLIGNTSPLPLSSLYLQAPWHSQNDTTVEPQVPRRLDPLAGIPVKRGYQCPECPSCYILPRGLRSHLLSDHDLSPELAESKLQSVLLEGSIGLQTLFCGRKTKFFPVTDNKGIGEVICKIILKPTDENTPTSKDDSRSPLPQSGPSPPEETNCLSVQKAPALTSHKSPLRQAVLDAFKSLLEPVPVNSNSDAIEGSRKSTFILTTQFDKVLEDCDITLERAVSLTAADDVHPTPWLKNLRSSIENYLSATGTHLRTMHPSFVHRINLRSNDGPFRLVSTATLKRYAIQVARFVVYLVRSSPPSTSATLESLRVSLRESSVETQPSRTELSLETIHGILKDDFLNCWPEFHSVDNLNVRNFLAAASVIQYKAMPLTASDSTHRAVPYRFAEASEMTHTLAALQYLCSVCAVHEMVKIRQTAENADNDEQNNLSQTKRRTDHLFDSLCIDKHTAASFIRKNLDLCMGLSNLEDVDLSFDNCQVHSSCGIVKHVHLALPKLGETVRAAVDSFTKTLHEEILLGESLPTGFMTTLESLTDNASARKPGLSFLSYNPLQVHWLQENMLYVLNIIRCPAEDYLHKTPYVFPDAVIEEGSHSPRIVTVSSFPMWYTKVLSFLTTCQKLQETLLSMIHISSGSPARATEIATYRLHNDHYAMRNIVLSQQDVTLIARYAKQKNMKGGARPILRFPDNSTSKCLVTYLALIRPLECEMVRALYGDEPMRNHWYWMFVDRGIPFTAKRIRNIVSSTLDSAGLPISFADYRHFTSGMVPVVCGSKLKAVISEMVDEFSATGHEQASHSPQTAEKVYARTTHQVSMVSSSEMARNREWCREWHRLLSLDIVKDQDRQFQKSEPEADNTDSVPDSPSHAIPQPQSPCAKKRKTSPPPPRPHDSRHIYTSPTTPVLGVGPYLHTPRPRSFENYMPLLLGALRETTGDQSAVFKSHTQFAVTASILADPDDKLVLMPTGSGKTMCILLPAAIEKGKNLSTIVVVPLVALQCEYEKRATLFGLDVSLRPSQVGSKEFSDVYVFTPEFLQKKEFAELVTRLSTTNGLARIVVDEAHLTFLWASFRTALKDIRLALALVPKDVPRVLLSATVPPEDRAALIAHHGLAQATLHSMPTLRRNLKFTVEHLSSETQSRGRDVFGTFSSPEATLIQGTVMNLYEHLHRLAATSKYPIWSGNFCRVIIYAFTRSACVSLYEALKAGITASHTRKEPLHLEVLMYHAGLSEQQKYSMHENWMDEERLDSSPDTFPCFRVMVCTSAFGTGLDCSDIRLSIHMGGANGLVDFIQETGRAGRDGKPSQCVTLYCPKYASFIAQTIRRRNDVNEMQNALRRWLQLEQWILNTDSCRKSWLYGFADGSSPGICLFDPVSVNCDTCDSCDGSPMSDFRSSNPSIQATPDTVRPWNTAVSSMSSLAPSLTPRFPSPRFPSPIDSFTNSLTNPVAVQTTRPTNTRGYHVLAPQPHATRPTNTQGYRPLRPPPGASQNLSGTTPSVPTASQLNVCRALQFIPTPPKPTTQHHTPTSYLEIQQFAPSSLKQAPASYNQTTVKRSFLNNQCAEPRQMMAPVSPKPTPPAHFEDSDPQTILANAHSLARLGKDLCFPCLIHKSHHVKHDSTSCPWLLNRCFRCFSSSHRVSACPVSRPPQGLCFKCGLRQLLGLKLHTSDFSYGAACGLFPLVIMSWSLWRCAAFQKQLAEEYFSNVQLQSYNELMVNSNAATRDPKFMIEVDNLYAEALSDGSSPFPTVIRIALAYASTTGLL